MKKMLINNSVHKNNEIISLTKGEGKLKKQNLFSKKILSKILSLTMVLLMIMQNIPGSLVMAEETPVGNTKVSYPEDQNFDVNQYPQYPNQGYVRMEKSAEWIDKSQGTAKITFNIKGQPKQQGVDAVLLIDSSQSMEEKVVVNTPGKGEKEIKVSRFDIAKDAATNFVNTMFTPAAGQTTSPNRIGIVTFSSGRVNTQSKDYKIEQAISDSSSSTVLKEKINAIKNYSAKGTSYEAAFKGAKEILDARTDKSRPAYIIFLTDGDYNSGVAYPQDAEDLKNPSKYNPAVVIYSVGFDLDNSYFNNIKTIATSNSHAYNIKDAAEMNPLYEKLAKNMKIAGTGAKLVDTIDSRYFHIDTSKTAIASHGTASVSGNVVTWDIGDITESGVKLEIFIKLNPELMGQLINSYPTNSSARLTYKNFDSKNNVQLVDSPELTIGAGKITQQYYLVNDEGKPSNNTGVIPFDSRTVIGDEPFITNINGNDTSLLPNGTYKPTAPSEITAGGKKYEYVPLSSQNGGNISGANVTININSNNQSDSIKTVYFGYKEVEKVTVSYADNHTDSSGFTSADPSSKEIYKGSAVETLPTEPTRLGYNFLAWNTEEDGSGNAFTADTQVLSNITVYAQWRASEGIEYKVEHHLQNLGDDDYTIDTAATETKIGTTGEDTQAQAKTTYTGFEPQAFAQEKIAANGKTVVKIYYDRNKYTVTYKPGENGNFTEDKHENVKYDSDRPEFRGVIEGKPGYQFNGWNPEPSLDIKVTKDLVYEAQWLEGNKITIQYIAKTDGVVSEIGGTVTNSLENLSPATGIAQGSIANAKDGYKFVNWTNGDGDIIYTTDSKYIPDKVGNLNIPGTYYANFAKDTIKWHTVTFETDGNGTLTGATEFKDILNGTKWGIAISSIPTYSASEGYSFKEWSPLLPVDPTDKIVSDRVYTATFEKNTYTITYKIIGEYFANEKYFEETYEYGEAITVLAKNMDETGYTFSGWSAIPNTMPSGPLTVTGYYEANNDTKYTVEHYQQNLAGDGYDIFETENGLKGITGKDAYAVAKNYKGFTENETHADRVSSGTILADGSLVLKLYYDRNKYTVTYSPGANGTFAEEKTENLPYGSETPKFSGSTTAKPGFTFTGWSPVVENEVTETVVYEAQWSEGDLVSISYVVSAAGGGIVSRSLELLGPVNGNAQGSSAIPNHGYKFVNWTKDGEEVSTSADFIPKRNSEGLNVSATYVANFEKETVEYTVQHINYDTNTIIKEITGQGEFGDKVTVYALDDEEYKAYNVNYSVQSLTLELDGNIIRFYYSLKPIEMDEKYVITWNYETGYETGVHTEGYRESGNGAAKGALYYVNIYPRTGFSYSTHNENITTREIEVPVTTESAITSGSAIVITGSAIRIEKLTLIDLYYNMNIYDIVYKIVGDYFTTDNYKTEQYVYGADVTPLADDMTRDGYTFSGWGDIPTKMIDGTVFVIGSYTKNPPVIPDGPENPDGPETPDDPETPVIPKTPEVTETPETPEEEIVDEEIPGGEIPAEEPKTDEELAEEEIEIEDEEIPAGALPYTAGLTAEVFYGLGGLSILLGTLLKKRKNNK